MYEIECKDCRKTRQRFVWASDQVSDWEMEDRGKLKRRLRKFPDPSVPRRDPRWSLKMLFIGRFKRLWILLFLRPALNCTYLGTLFHMAMSMYQSWMNSGLSARWWICTVLYHGCFNFYQDVMFTWLYGHGSKHDLGDLGDLIASTARTYMYRDIHSPFTTIY